MYKERMDTEYRDKMGELNYWQYPHRAPPPSTGPHRTPSLRTPERPFNRFYPQRHSYMGPPTHMKKTGLQRNESIQGSDVYHYDTRIPLPGLYNRYSAPVYQPSVNEEMRRSLDSNPAFVIQMPPPPMSPSSKPAPPPPIISQAIPEESISEREKEKGDLPRHPVAVYCPKCCVSVTTQIKYSATRRTHCLAWGLCWILTPLTCLFYCTPCCRMAYHVCPRCKTFLGSSI